MKDLGHARLMRALSVMLAAGFALAACQGPGPSPQSGEPSASGRRAASQEYRFNLGGEPPGLDPPYVSWDTSIAVLAQLFEGLVTFDDSLKLVPAGARELPSRANGGISADGKTITFKLRDDLRWTDGRRVTAQDYAYGLRRLFDPDKGAEYASFFFDVAGAQSYFTAKGSKDQPRTVTDAELRGLQEAVGIKAVDDATLQITLAQPRPTFLHLAALWPAYPVRQDVVERNGDRWTEAGNLVGNGPFKLAEWVHQDHITLVPNEHYREPKPNLTRMTLRMVTDATADFAAFLNGEVDGVRVPLSNVPQVLADEAQKPGLKRVPNLTTYAVQFNVKRPPFDRREVRQAFSQAIDREVFIAQVQRGVGKPAYSWIPPGMLGHQEKLGKDINKFDPAGARRLLAEAGYPDGRGLPAVTFQYSNTGSNALRAQFVQGQLKDNLGVEIALEPMEPSSFSRLVNSNQHQLAFFGWMADYPDPDNWLPELFGTGGGTNHTQYSNPHLDDMMRRAMVEADDNRRLQLWGDVQEAVVKDVPMIFLMHEEQFVLFKPYVQGVKVTANDSTALPGKDSLKEVWLAER